jgi:hypothetical protein
LSCKRSSNVHRCKQAKKLCVSKCPHA